MALDRTWYNTLVDDSGSGADGTIWNKAAVNSLMNAIDASLAAIGTWLDIPFNATDFTASGAMTWTLTAPDVTTLQVMYLGKTMIVNFVLATTSVGGTPSTDLRVKIPGLNVSNKTVVGGVVRVSDNGSAGEAGVCVVAAGGTDILIRRSPAIAPPNWSASTNNTTVQGFMIFERQ